MAAGTCESKSGNIQLTHAGKSAPGHFRLIPSADTKSMIPPIASSRRTWPHAVDGPFLSFSERRPEVNFAPQESTSGDRASDAAAITPRDRRPRATSTAMMPVEPDALEVAEQRH